MPTAVALRKAQELGLDLVWWPPPPFRPSPSSGLRHYTTTRKRSSTTPEKQHVVQVKELKFRPNTDDHDYDFKMNHAIRFLAEAIE